ncbi:RHS repeat-associated core domain-containing protein [Curtobacterium sp. ISL-83]|uniref:RHS repeat-associated core domain-containing protein n=1 Tax=Curtobacterium sp. ISL-83 TaxID=2819145 RepID=UPI001BED3836|nr:RHS repeat-associated core domain-containing protein [Curtobacterium sp. ISL-83]MBT2502392.1 hypothetical protein [Curtobacterium sp. ISL-83]
MTEHGIGGADDVTSTSSYPEAGTPNPHAVQSVTDSAVGRVGAFGYDADGNTTTTPGRTLTYDALGRVATVTKDGATETDVHDADGALLVQADPNTGTTLFLGNTEVHKATDGTVTATRTYVLDGIVVDERTTTGGSNKVFALDTDVDGTADLEIGATDKSVTRRWFDPFGNARGTVPVWSSPHGFRNAGGSAGTGLVQLGGREYDPTLGRFLSAVACPAGGPLLANGYSFRANDPVTDTDPEGACTDGQVDRATTPDHEAPLGSVSAAQPSGVPHQPLP